MLFLTYSLHSGIANNSALCAQKPPTGSTILDVRIWCGLSLESTSVVSETRDATPSLRISTLSKEFQPDF